MTRSSPTRLYKLGIRRRPDNKPHGLKDFDFNPDGETFTVADGIVAQAISRWNKIVPKRAVVVLDEGGTHFAYLHPTKGWRAVNRTRVM